MRLKKLDKIRLVVMLPLSLAFIVVGSIALSIVDQDQQTDLSSQLGTNFLNTETEDVSAQIPPPQSTSIPVPSSNPVVSSPAMSPVVSPEVSPVNSRQSTSTASSQAQSAQDPSDTEQACEPMKEYCNPPGANLLDDVLFNQSHDGSFENPICTLQPDGSISGKGCEAVTDRPTHYQADNSALLPINSQAFFTEGGNYQRPEYIRQEVAGEQQCQEKLTAHGHNAFKIFSRGGHGLKGGLCLPMKAAGSTKVAGINFRVSQQTGSIDNNVPVTFKLGYITSAPQNNTYFGSSPSLSEGSISWVDSQVITSADYAGDSADNSYAARYAGGFLEGQLPSNAQGFCFMAESSGGNGINTFWDAAFASTDANACENALDHSDGVDRSCGGYVCGNVDPTYSGNYYTDFDQEYYPFDMPDHWNANQCHFEAASNGAESPNGTLFVGLDLNSCDPNYKDPAQRNLHPEFEKDDVKCADNRNWIYGYAWTGGIKDFGLLQYLDCAIGTLQDVNFKGTESNPFFCSQILKAYSNTRTQPQEDDPAFTLRYSNTYSGLVSSIQAEGNANFWKVPLLGSAVGTGVINNRQVYRLRIDPFLLGTRNSGSGLNNMLKYSMGELADYLISQRLRVEEHQFEESVIPHNEVMVADLLASGPVCADIEGDPITKIHYGSESGVSDRAIFGFADDEGSSEHIIHAENTDITPEELCNFQFRDNRVTGATCTFFGIGDGKNVTFTESNINSSLEQEGYVGRITVPTYAPPMEPGIPLPGYEECPSVNLCGTDFKCGDSMRQLYDACIGSRLVDEIGGNPFIRQELPNGWEDLQIHGLNKLMEATWHNEYIQYNHVVRHENVGIDVNQVVSIYDQQQPKCTALGDDRKPVYCSDDTVVNKAAQVCRRVSPYDCGCNPSNFSTCLLNCPALFQRPEDIPTEGLEIEGTPLPTPSVEGEKSVDTSIRAILNNSYPSFLEQFVRMLEPKTYEGEGGRNYEEGQIYNYNPRYTGGFLLANTGSGTSQCTSDTSPGSKTGASQVRMENYYAYVGQVPRMNERIGFAGTNNKDEKTVDQLEISIDATVGAIQLAIESGGTAYPHIALPYCDLLSEERKSQCGTSTDASCDCLVRTCEQQLSDKRTLAKRYLPMFCEKLQHESPEAYNWIMRAGGTCEQNLQDSFEATRFQPAFEQCQATPKTNLDFNCDPMANYLISQGFDTAELRFAACDDMFTSQQCNYDKFGVHLITGPVQEANYSRAENLGLKWKMEVITEDTPGMIEAMAQSVNSFSGKTVFRFCNADQGNPGSKIQDQSCAFRTELTGSPEASGRKAAQMIVEVSKRTSKGFAVAPINEPISEHWYALDPVNDPNDLSFTNTMPAVSAFYTAFVNELSSDTTAKGKVEVGGPTYNVTAFGNYQNFERLHNEFSAKDLVDYWTINIYNHDDLPAEVSQLETQFAHVKTVFNDSKLIGINETGDFQHNMERLKTSLSTIGSDSRLKYALLFNAFGGWGDSRGHPLVMTDGEIRGVLSGNRSCASDNQCYVDDDGGTVKANPLPFGRNFTMVYDQLLSPGSSGGRSCSELPPAAGEYYDPSDVGMKCEAFGVRSQLPQYNFYRGALKRCGIPAAQTRWTEQNTYNQGGDIQKIKNQILAKNITYGGRSLNEANEEKLVRLLTRAKETNRNPMVLISIWATESVFGLYGNRNEFNCFSNPVPTDFNSSLECVLRITYMVDRPMDEFVDRYGPFCDNETYATGSGNDGGGELICPDPGTGGITTPECFVSPMNGPFIVTQCFGNTVDRDSSNEFCLNKFPSVGLTGYTYPVIGQFHSGIDMVNSTNRDVFASAAGTVTEVKSDPGGYGNYVVIEHELANSSTVFYSRYAHLASTNVSVGQTVNKDTKIGVMGSTGNSSGPHLHFEIASFPQKVNPLTINRSVLHDPTTAILRDRNTPNTACSAPNTTDLVEVGSENGITRYNLDGLIIVKIDKNSYNPTLEWDTNAKTLRSWAGSSSAQVLINGSLFESNYTSSGRLKIRNTIVQGSMSSAFASSSGQGYLAFNFDDFNIRESSSLSLGSHQNILESVPILILDGKKYTSNGSVTRRNTSIGYDQSGNYIIVIAPVEGKHSYSKIADLVLGSGLNIHSLLNLDGGGSTGLIIKGGSIAVDASSSRAIPGILTFTRK